MAPFHKRTLNPSDLATQLQMEITATCDRFLKANPQLSEEELLMALFDLWEQFGESFMRRLRRFHPKV